MKKKMALLLLSLLGPAHSEPPKPNHPHIGDVYQNGNWTEKENPRFTFELHKYKKSNTKYQVRTIPARIDYDSSQWDIDTTLAAAGTVSFKKRKERMAYVVVKVRKGYLKKDEIRKWLLQQYAEIYGKSENKSVNLDEVNGKEFSSYLFVNEYKGTHVVAYDMVHADIQNTLIITTLCFGVDHLRLYQKLMEFVSGVEAYNSL